MNCLLDPFLLKVRSNGQVACCCCTGSWLQLVGSVDSVECNSCCPGWPFMLITGKMFFLRTNTGLVEWLSRYLYGPYFHCVLLILLKCLLSNPNQQLASSKVPQSLNFRNVPLDLGYSYSVCFYDDIQFVWFIRMMGWVFFVTNKAIVVETFFSNNSPA